MAAMVDCRSLIEFCRAFEQHRHRPKTPPSPPRRSPRSRSLNPLSHPFCEHSPIAAIDAAMLVLVLAAISVLAVPYFRFLLHQALIALSALPSLSDVIRHAPLAYFAGVALTLATAVAGWEIFGHQLRKCGSPYCKGLRKAVEFDIQLESEECVRRLPPAPMGVFGGGAFVGTRKLELGGDDREELEAELKKMAPLNGRTVLVFRARCGCPAGRMEVWGAKKVRRIKK